MKKFKMLAACLVLTLSLSALTACGTNRNNTNTNNSGNNPSRLWSCRQNQHIPTCLHRSQRRCR